MKARAWEMRMGTAGRHADGVRVGFYGCDRLDRVVRVAEIKRQRFPARAAEVDCPCGRQHKVGIAWRSLLDGEELRAEVEV